MTAVSHHVQGVELSPQHCSSCHWEATTSGAIDPRYHGGEKGREVAVDLVVWGAGGRPEAHEPGRTAVSFKPAAIGTGREREEVAQVTRHCLGCHSDGNNEVAPFKGDRHTPRAYAWDGQSIGSRYAEQGTTTWGKYSTAGSNRKKRVVKAYSAHGNALANQGGWRPAIGYDGEMPQTRGGAAARNVECFDCHNAHGSAIAGTTTSYRTHDGSFSGGILKQTRAGQGGYRMTYSPSVNGDPGSPNPFNAGAGLCFDCHESPEPGFAPWGYNATYGAAQPIMGYKDTSHFAPGVKGSTARFANRQGRTGLASSHLKAGRFLAYSTHGRINGLCTPCHDPHGVSRTLGGQMPYAVPLLKGAWLTSPYREDGPPFAPAGPGGPAGRDMNTVGGGSVGEPMSIPGARFNVDRNTFGNGGRITEDDATFGGLCFNCHRRKSLTGASSSGQVHRAVKGWGENTEHAFPCAKCHQAHNSGLPRLMQTNCFETGPSGLREKSGIPWQPVARGGRQEQSAPVKAGGVADGEAAKGALVGCHVRQSGRGAGGGGNPAGGAWIERSGW